MESLGHSYALVDGNKRLTWNATWWPPRRERSPAGRAARRGSRVPVHVRPGPGQAERAGPSRTGCRSSPRSGRPRVTAGRRWRHRRAGRISASSGRRLRQFVTKVTPCGTLKCAMRSRRMRASRPRSRRRPRAARRTRAGTRPTARRHADDADLDAPRDGAAGPLDLDRRDVLAAADDHVLDAVADLHVAVGVNHGGVARVEPAVAHRRCGRLGVVVVPFHHDVAAHGDLAERLPSCGTSLPSSSTTSSSPEVTSSTPCRALMSARSPGDRSRARAGARRT